MGQERNQCAANRGREQSLRTWRTERRSQQPPDQWHEDQRHEHQEQSQAEDADGRAETPIETLARIMLVKMGITDLVPQFTIHLRQGRRAEVDLYSPELRHAFETDGRLKYVNQVDRFGRELTADDVVWMEKRREDEVRSQNVGVSRLYWWHVQRDAFPRTSARLWQEIRDQAAARRLPPSA